MELFIVTLIIVALCIALLSVRLFFGRSFVKTHVDQSKAMRQRGIRCVQSQDAEARIENAKRVKEKRNETSIHMRHTALRSECGIDRLQQERSCSAGKV